jgi:hypothetical protein
MAMVTVETLWKAGVNAAGVAKLLKLRNRYAEIELTEQFSDAEKHRLEFTRWLIQQGRLSG